MVVCKFFLQGNCRFGANCRNEHPSGQSGSGGGGGSGGGFGNQNRFGALSNTGTNRFGGASDNSKPYNLNTTDIRLDLTHGQGRPQWILSTYGAGRGTPASLFEGNEYSMEEIRVRFYEMASKGQEAQADQEAIQLWNKAEQDVDNAARHIDDIVKFMEEAEKKHPNRYDLCKTDGTKSIEEIAKAAGASNSSASGFGNSSPFGQAPNNNSNPFSKPAAATFGQASTPSAFGGSAFGKPAQTSAFGQPSFGQSAFGASTAAKPSPFGQSSTPTAFGQPAAASAFGKPAFGASAFGQPAFGQAAQATTTSPFGQATQTPKPSPFGQAAASSGFGASPFGQAAKPNPFAAPAASSGFGAGTSAFGQSAQTSSPFGQAAQSSPAFGQPSQPSTAFGQPAQPSGFGQSGFGQPAQPSAFGQSAFGQPAQPAASSPFGQAKVSSPFGAGNTQASPFGQAAQQTASPFSKPEEPRIVEVSMEADAPSNPPAQEPVNNPFGMSQAAPTTQFTPAPVSLAPAPAPTQQAQPTTNNSSEKPQLPTTKPAQPLHYNQTLPQAVNTYNQFKRLDTYRGQRLQWMTKDPAEVPTYRRPDGKGLEKIWFPDAGATQEVVTLNKEDKISDLQEDNDRYTDEITKQFAYLFDEGRFRDGKIPIVPPIREWCAYDF